MTFSEIKDKIVKVLNSQKNRFKSREFSNKSKHFGLRSRQAPPLVHSIVLPANGPVVSEKYIREYCKDKFRIHILPKR